MVLVRQRLRVSEFGGVTLGKIISHSRWTKSFENFFKSFTQLTSRLGLIRGLISLIRKLDRVSILLGPNPDLHCGYHPRANFLGLNGYHAALFPIATHEALRRASQDCLQRLSL